MPVSCDRRVSLVLRAAVNNPTPFAVTDVNSLIGDTIFNSSYLI